MRNKKNAPKKDKNIRIVQLADYERKEANEVTSNQNDYVTWGEDNSVFNELINAYDHSVTNRRLIDGITEMIYGRGLSALDSNKKPEMYARMKSLLPEKEVMRIVSDFYKLGRFAIQVNWDSGHKSWSSIYHADASKFALEEADDEGEIKAVWFTNDWKDTRKNPPQRIPLFGTSKEKVEILYGVQYQSGHFYFPQASWQSALGYAHMEEEMNDFHNNEISMGFSATKLINFNNGVPDLETQKQIEKDVTNKWAGGKAKSKIVIAFNDDKDSQATIDDIQLGDAHDRYKFLSDEAEDKLMMAHKVVYPLFTYDRTGTGLGNNAEELKNAYELMMEMVIRPKQDFLIKAFDDLLEANDVALRLFFEPLKPVTWQEDVVITDSETAQEQGVNMSEEVKDFDDIKMLDALSGESVDDEQWELVDSREFSEDNESDEEWATRLIAPIKTLFTKLSDFITSKPSKESYLDKSYYKVRYKYSQKYSSGNSRAFCKQMMARSGKGVVYRLEDIDKASREGVNQKFGHNGQPYDLFKYKGGRSCGHYWSQELYRLKKKTNGKYVEDKALSSSEIVKSIPKSYVKTPTGTKESKIAPKDMPNQGAYPQ